MGQVNEKVCHTFPPIYDRHSRVLILGTFPSVKSRENDFYYGHPQNRFWKVMAGITGSVVPQTKEEKIALLLTHRIAIWDVVQSCRITGSSDSSIKDVVANDIAGMLKESRICRIFGNGEKACKLYEVHCQKESGFPIRRLPSTSPANAASSLEKLIREWAVVYQSIECLEGKMEEKRKEK